MPLPNDQAVALFTHLGGGLLFGAGVFAAAVAAEVARAQRAALAPPALVAVLQVGRVGAIAAMAGAVVLLAGGLALAGKLNVWGAAWAQASIVLTVAALVLGAVGGGRAKRARILATRLAAEPAASAALLPSEDVAQLQRLLADPAARALNYSAVALIVVVLALMVWRPT